MAFWAEVWDKIVALHEAGDLTLLVPFYGVVAAIIVFVCLQLMLVRGRLLALKAARAARDLMTGMGALQAQVDELESRLEGRVDARTGDLDARMTRKIDQKGDLIQERLEQHRGALSESVARLEARVTRSVEQLEAFRERVDEVEGRIPGLFDRLNDFRDTLAQTFQAELGSVLNSFDNSINAILQQMKAELQLGISRIESIEGMVRSRERAERSLLGTREEPALPDSLAREEGEFEEWEQQAKELAEKDEGELEEPEAISTPPQEPDRAEYPAEMGAPEADDATDELESELYMGPAEPPEGDDVDEEEQ